MMNSIRCTGVVKWFNLIKGFGFITRDDGEDVFVHQSAIKAQSFRSLEEGECVEFGVIDSDKGKIAIQVSGIGGGNVKGASRKSRKKKGARKLTNLCFNCNEPGHVLKDCPSVRVNSRTCHKCGGNGHLIRKCPELSEEQRKLLVDKKTDNIEQSNIPYSVNEIEKDVNGNSLTQILGKHSIMFEKGNGSSSSEESEEFVDEHDGCSQVKRQRLEPNAGVESYCKTVNGHNVYNPHWAKNHDLQPISSCS